MPTLTSGNQTVRFSDGPLYQFSTSYPASSLTSTSFRVNWGSEPYSYQVSGTGLSDTTGDGHPDVGTITAISVYANGSVLFTISGINRSASDVYSHSSTLLDYLLSGNDTINGSTVDDYFSAFGGSDTFRMGGGNDSFVNYGYVESGVTLRIYGDAGNDTIIQYYGATTAPTTMLLDGGVGNDRFEVGLYSYQNLSLTINGGDGDDFIFLTLIGGSEVYSPMTSVVSGGAGFDVLRLGATSTTLQQFLTNTQFSSIEQLNLTSGWAELTCDQVNLFGQLASYVADAPAPDNLQQLYLVLTDIGVVDLSDAVVLNMSVQASNAGNDITLGNTNDTLTGGFGDDILRGGGGNDTITGNGGTDQMFGDAGNDTFNSVNGGVQNVGGILDGGAGLDHWNGFQLSTTAGVTFDANQAATAVGYTLLDGTILRNMESFSVSFGSGDDTFIDYGGGGDDNVNMGYGNNTIHVSAGLDSVAGAGTDVIYVDYSSATGALTSALFVTLDRWGWESCAVWQGSASDVNATSLRVFAQTGSWGIEEWHITGSAFDDRLFGFMGDDFINGGAGDDVLTAELGTDTLNGGPGSDWLNFQLSGDMTIRSGATIDLAVATAQALPTYYGIPYFDTGVHELGFVILSSVENVEGTTYADTLLGSSADNRLYGLSGDDVLNGREGNDVLRGGGGSDQLIGGAGSDTADYTGTLSAVTVSLALSGAQNTGGSGIDTLSSIENLIGGFAADTLTGNSGANVINGGAGADTMRGMAGDDTYYVDNVNDVVQESVSNGIDLVLASVSYALSAHVENLTLVGSSNINATGNSLANLIIGNDGANALNGGAGADIMRGGLGNDTYYVDDAGDRVVELAAAGADTVSSSISYTLTANVENLVLTGTATRATGNSLANQLTGNALANVLNGGTGADTMSGGLGDDTYYVDNVGDVILEANGAGRDLVYANISYTLAANVDDATLTGSGAVNATGNGLANRLIGNAAANVLDGGAGADIMRGGLGNDTYHVDNTGDRVVELSGQGVDTVFSSITYKLTANVENLTLTGTAFRATGNTLANVLVGTSGNNVLNGGFGNDTMSGGAGNDIYFVFETGDSIIENAGQGRDRIDTTVTFTMPNNVEDMYLRGSSAINGTGNALDNLVSGNSDNNILDGRGGADDLRGGNGADTFVFRDGEFGGLTSSTADRIIDFNHDQNDHIDLSAVDANTLLGGDQAFSFIGTTGFHGVAGELRYQQLGGNTYVYGDTDGDGRADFMIRVDGLHSLALGDFVI